MFAIPPYPFKKHRISKPKAWCDRLFDNRGTLSRPKNSSNVSNTNHLHVTIFQRFHHRTYNMKTSLSSDARRKKLTAVVGLQISTFSSIGDLNKKLKLYQGNVENSTDFGNYDLVEGSFYFAFYSTHVPGKIYTITNIKYPISNYLCQELFPISFLWHNVLLSSKPAVC